MSVREAETAQQRTPRPKVIAVAVVVVVAAISIAGWPAVSGANVFGLGQPKVWTVSGLEATASD